MGDSFFRKFKKILEKPEAPPHIRQRKYEVIIPWHRRLWSFLRPPSPVPSQRKRMNRSQRRLVFGSLAAMVVGASAWGTYNYAASAPDRARAAYEQGLTRLGPGDFAGAIEKFSQSLSIYETAEAYLGRGNAALGMGRKDEALADWNKAILLDPSLAGAFTARGTHRRMNGELQDALTDLTRSIQLSASVEAYFQRGQVFDALGEHEKAIQDYSLAIQARREAPYIYLARSVARRAIGDEEGFRQDQATAQELQQAR